MLRQLGWSHFIKTLQHPLDTAPNITSLPHSAAPYLQRLADNGVPAPSHSQPWSKSKLPHLLRFEDFLDMVQKGYWTILPFSSLKHFSHLKLSPAVVVPQQTRRPRPIMDYRFTGVNDQSLPLSPTQAMQLGHTLPRLLQHIAYANPAHGLPLLLKLNLADGYYRVWLTPEAALELAVVIRWAHSPPYFCAFTKTSAD